MNGEHPGAQMKSDQVEMNGCKIMKAKTTSIEKRWGPVPNQPPIVVWAGELCVCVCSLGTRICRWAHHRQKGPRKPNIYVKRPLKWHGTCGRSRVRSGRRRPFFFFRQRAVTFSRLIRHLFSRFFFHLGATIIWYAGCLLLLCTYIYIYII